MATVLKLEQFNPSAGQLGKRAASMFFRPDKPWVAEIMGVYRSGKLSRRFLNGNTDYSRANSVGSRGVFKVYYLADGKPHEINERYSWKGWRRYFCVPHEGELLAVTEEWVREWVSMASESTYSMPPKSA